MTAARTIALLMIPFAIATGEPAWAQNTGADVGQNKRELKVVPQPNDPPRPDLFKGPLQDGSRFSWFMAPAIGRVFSLDHEVGIEEPVDIKDCKAVIEFLNAVQNDLSEIKEVFREAGSADRMVIFGMPINRSEAQAWIQGLEAELKKVEDVYETMDQNKDNIYGCPRVS